MGGALLSVSSWEEVSAFRWIYTLRFCRMEPPYVRITYTRAYDTFLGHDYREVSKHVFKSYELVSCHKCVVRRLHTTESYGVNWSYGRCYSWECLMEGVCL